MRTKGGNEIERIDYYGMILIHAKNLPRMTSISSMV